MKLLKFFAKLSIAFLIFGAIASLILSHSKEEYVTFQKDNNNLDLY